MVLRGGGMEEVASIPPAVHRPGESRAELSWLPRKTHIPLSAREGHYMMIAGTSTFALMLLCGRMLPPLT